MTTHVPAAPVTTHVSAWFVRDADPPASGVSPICRAERSHVLHQNVALPEDSHHSCSFGRLTTIFPRSRTSPAFKAPMAWYAPEAPT